MDNKIKETLKKLIKEELELTRYSDNEEENKFLNKVKEENPDRFPRFLNIVKNKGLETAKEKYKPYDKGSSMDNDENKRLIKDFVNFLPQSIVDEYTYLKNKYQSEKKPKEILYLYLGYHINNYGKKKSWEDADKLRYIFDSGKYDKKIFIELANRFKKIFP